MRQDNRGIALTEVLVAMLIVGLTVPFVMGAVMGALRQTRGSQDRSVATGWIQGEVEYLRRQCYARLSVGESRPPSQPGEPALPDTFPPGYVRIEICSTSTCPGWSPGTPLKKATVSISKTDWVGTGPPPNPLLTTVTYIGDLRMGAACETSQ